MLIQETNFEEILKALDRQIGIHGGSSIGLVVCGGTALLALGLLHRTTRDVDVLAQYIAEKGTKELKEFPDWLVAAANKVARDFNLPEEWLNLGPAAQVKTGLPEGLEKRLVKRSYGKYLTIYYISRKDQIYFKLYAAVDRDDYHIDDLFALNPTEAELEKAARWVLTQDISKEFRLILIDFLEKFDYGNIAEKI